MVAGVKRRRGTHASSEVLMAFLIPSAPRASVPYGSLDEPEILLSPDTPSDSSLCRYVRVSRFFWHMREAWHAPEQGGKMRHAPNGEDLVLDHFAPLGKITSVTAQHQ